MNTEEIAPLINLSTGCLQTSKSLLEGMLAHSDEAESLSTDDALYHLQLLLQYRLSSQDALAYLLRIQQNLLDLLGVQPDQSASMNLDRLAFALGTDDLKNILNILSVLIDSLTKIVYHNQQEEKHFKLRQQALKNNFLSKNMQKLSLEQEKLINALDKIQEYTEQLHKAPVDELDLDYIASLTGPMLQFYEEVIHLLGLSQTLYHISNEKQPIHELVKKANHVLSINKPHPHHGPGLFDHKEPTKSLEERAAIKRLRPFFS